MIWKIAMDNSGWVNHFKISPPMILPVITLPDLGQNPNLKLSFMESDHFPTIAYSDM